jgi:hypothetical protein
MSRTTLSILILFLGWTTGPAVRADDGQPTEKESATIAAHAGSWNLLLLREHLKVMVVQWGTLVTDPAAASAHFEKMLPVADSVVDRLALATGYSRGRLMRWLEGDVGAPAYFVPPGPERVESSGSGIWKFLGPLVPVIVYRVIDRVVD